MKRKSLFTAFVVVLTTVACKSYDGKLSDGLYAAFETNHGEFVIELNYQEAPLTVANFVSLAEGTNTEVDEKFKGKKFYDGLIFHRIIDGFMIQGGDPDGNGMGGPGYQFADEVDTGLKHDSKGVLSMANAGPGTNGSQFFITLAPTPHLNGRHTVFGKVVLGQEVVDEIGKVETNQNDKPEEDVIIEHVKIIRKGKPAKKFDAAKVFGDEIKAKEKAKEEAEAKFEQLKADAETTTSGLQYIITKKVEGAAKPNEGDEVSVYYKGMLSDGKVFDQRLETENQQPIKFPVGTGRVIPGWDEGLQLIGEGEEATLIIPPHLAYGQRGAGGVIPPNATLIFEVKLDKIN